MRNKAFVKVRKGNFPDANYYAAWKGFNDMGYEVVKFEEDTEATIDVHEDTPVFAGVGSCRKIIKRVWGWDYVGINPYPDELQPYMHRTYERKKWIDARETALEGHMFIKPVIQKQFTGVALCTLLDKVRTANVKEDDEVFVVEPVNFVSEWRVYVHEHEIVAFKPYYNKEVYDYQLIPYYPEVKRMVQAYRPSAPIAYGMDVGLILDDRRYKSRDKLPADASVNALTSLVEINDGICLGNYGLDPMNYAEMIADRWLELTTKGKPCCLTSQST